ncbi:MAG: molybdenum cofactor biosynthesis protein MoaE [Thermodesulfobacteriota bacterium]|nr:molybdenum cofactor biosynthesis protein MoaE [Thermodesulfobacteriota bacterium]
MDISKTIAQMKQDSGFADNVGMVLVHNGIVRGWSRSDGSTISQMEVISDLDKIEQIRCDIEQMQGIYKVAVEARSGIMQPGDDILFLVVAGDIREHVKPALALLLERIKTEGVSKKEMGARKPYEHYES